MTSDVRLTVSLLVLLGFPGLGPLAAAQAAAQASQTSRAEVEKVALRVAEGLNGVLRNCPASFAKIGTPVKRCVGLTGSVEQARSRLSAVLGTDLYGVWRSRDEQRSVFNWVRAPGGYVYLRLQADPDGRAGTLAYLDLPPDSAAAPSPAGPGTAAGTGAGTVAGTATVTLTPAAPAPTSTPVPTVTVRPPSPAAGPAAGGSAPSSPATNPAPSSAPSSATSPATNPPAGVTPAVSLAPTPFRRVLSVQAPRLNGPDVLAVQNRLIALTRPWRGGRGDGWYGPVTAATVRQFQAANRLPVTGQVDRATWDRLFSASAQTFAPPRP